jgi:hypothetical protein
MRDSIVPGERCELLNKREPNLTSSASRLMATLLSAPHSFEILLHGFPRPITDKPRDASGMIARNPPSKALKPPC